AVAAVPLAASAARPRTRSRRLNEPFSKRDTRLEMIDSMVCIPRKMDLQREYRASSGGVARAGCEIGAEGSGRLGRSAVIAWPDLQSSTPCAWIMHVYHERPGLRDCPSSLVKPGNGALG